MAFDQKEVTEVISRMYQNLCLEKKMASFINVDLGLIIILMLSAIHTSKVTVNK